MWSILLDMVFFLIEARGGSARDLAGLGVYWGRSGITMVGFSLGESSLQREVIPLKP